MKRDNVFLSNRKIDDFVFDEHVAEVFDDMLNRSVPMYSTIQELIVKFCGKYNDKGRVVDLGCSHGHTCINIASQLDCSILGIDNSIPMIEKARQNLNSHKALKGTVSFEHLDINPSNIDNLSGAGVFILSLTLQFIRPLERPLILKSIFDNLKSGGILILVEKTIQPIHSLNSIFIDLYHEFKMSNGYSEIEVSKKRIALENVLVPYSIEENKEMLRDSGFKDVSTFFQWLNFSGIIAIK